MNTDLERKTRELAHGLWRAAGDRADQPMQFWLIAETMVRELMTRQLSGPS